MRVKKNYKQFFIIIGTMLFLTAAGLMVNYLSASSDGEPEPEPVDTVAVETQTVGPFHCAVEIRDDLHTVDAFFGVVETHPAEGQWPVITTHSHTAETLGYKLIQIRGLSVPSQFSDRTRPLIFAERERRRFDKAMTYVWSLISQSETLILRNPEAVKDEGYVICDVSVKVGGHELNLADMLIADGHARPSGNWDWGARHVYEIKEQTENETH